MSATQPTIVPTSYAEDAASVQKDASTSFWLRRAIFDLERRDPVDVISDLETALRLAVKRNEEMSEC